MLREGESTPPSRRDHTRPLCPQGHRCRCREATTASQVTAIARSHAEAEARQPTDNIDSVGQRCVPTETRVALSHSNEDTLFLQMNSGVQ